MGFDGRRMTLSRHKIAVGSMAQLHQVESGNQNYSQSAHGKHRDDDARACVGIPPWLQSSLVSLKKKRLNLSPKL